MAQSGATPKELSEKLGIPLLRAKRRFAEYFQELERHHKKLVVRVSKTLKQALEAEASIRGTSVCGVIRKILEDRYSGV